MREVTKDYILDCYKNIKMFHSNERSELWIAEHQLTEKLFVKRILPYSESCMKTFEKLKTLNHPNIIQIIEVINSDEKLIIIEEYVEGKSLSDLMIDKQGFQEKEVIIMIKQLCQALHILHSNDIVHRDIKPSNIMYEGGAIKLIDFDTARFFNVGVCKDTKLLGTEGYASPEQFGFSQSDPRTDIYSLGVTLYELLTGELPKGTLKYRGRLKGIIKRCLQFDPGKRYQSAKDVEKSLFYIQHRKKFIEIFSVSIILIIGIFAFNIKCNTNISEHLVDKSMTEESVKKIVTEQAINQAVNNGVYTTGNSLKISTEGNAEPPEETLGGVEPTAETFNQTIDSVNTILPTDDESDDNESEPQIDSTNLLEFPDLKSIPASQDGFEQLLKRENVEAAIKDASGSYYETLIYYFGTNGTTIYDKDLKLYYYSNYISSIEIWQDGSVRMGYYQNDFQEYHILIFSNNSGKDKSSHMEDWINQRENDIEEYRKLEEIVDNIME